MLSDLRTPFDQHFQKFRRSEGLDPCFEDRLSQFRSQSMPVLRFIFDDMKLRWGRCSKLAVLLLMTHVKILGFVVLYQCIFKVSVLIEEHPLRRNLDIKDPTNSKGGILSWKPKHGCP